MGGAARYVEEELEDDGYIGRRGLVLEGAGGAVHDRGDSDAGRGELEVRAS